MKAAKDTTAAIVQTILPPALSGNIPAIGPKITMAMDGAVNMNPALPTGICFSSSRWKGKRNRAPARIIICKKPAPWARVKSLFFSRVRSTTGSRHLFSWTRNATVKAKNARKLARITGDFQPISWLILSPKMRLPIDKNIKADPR